MAANQSVEFSERSTGADLNVNITQECRDYSEHFQMYKFWYVMRMNFSRGSDSTIFVSYLLNVHSNAWERVFSVVLRVMVQSVQLQHFNSGCLRLFTIYLGTLTMFMQVDLLHMTILVLTERLVE